MAPEIIGQTEFIWDDNIAPAGGLDQLNYNENNKSKSKQHSKSSRSSRGSSNAGTGGLLADDDIDPTERNNRRNSMKVDPNNSNNNSLLVPTANTPSAAAAAGTHSHSSIHSHQLAYAADIWSVGITALELAYGSPPHASADPKLMRKLVLQGPVPSAANYRDNSYSFSDSFHSFISACLHHDPASRATATELLQHKFIKKASKKNTAALNKHIADKIVIELIKRRTIKLSQLEKEKQKLENNQKKKKL